MRLQLKHAEERGFNFGDISIRDPNPSEIQKREEKYSHLRKTPQLTRNSSDNHVQGIFGWGKKYQRSHQGKTFFQNWGNKLAIGTLGFSIPFEVGSSMLTNMGSVDRSWAMGRDNTKLENHLRDGNLKKALERADLKFLRIYHHLNDLKKNGQADFVKQQVPKYTAEVGEICLLLNPGTHEEFGEHLKGEKKKGLPEPEKIYPELGKILNISVDKLQQMRPREIKKLIENYRKSNDISKIKNSTGGDPTRQMSLYVGNPANKFQLDAYLGGKENFQKKNQLDKNTRNKYQEIFQKHISQLSRLAM